MLGVSLSVKSEGNLWAGRTTHSKVQKEEMA